MTRSSAFFKTTFSAFRSHLTAQLKAISSIAIVLILLLIFLITGEKTSYAFHLYTGILPFMAVICTVSAGIVYYRLPQTLCCTRRANWIGSQLAKLLAAVIFFLLILLFAAASQWINGEKRALSSLFVSCGGLFMLLELFANLSFGELLAIFCQRFGKVGMILYIILCSGIGGFIGFLSVLASDTIDGSAASAEIIVPVGGLSITLFLAAAILFSGVSYLLIRRADIK